LFSTLNPAVVTAVLLELKDEWEEANHTAEVEAATGTG
jgi:hypothetical protein